RCPTPARRGVGPSIPSTQRAGRPARGHDWLPRRSERREIVPRRNGGTRSEVAYRFYLKIQFDLRSGLTISRPSSEHTSECAGAHGSRSGGQDSPPPAERGWDMERVIYADADEAAVVIPGNGLSPVPCPTLQDAVLYFRQIDPEGRRDAVIETMSGRTFAAED